MKNLAKMFCLLCCLWGQSAWAWERPEMAKYGAAYAGPELLRVYVAHTWGNDHAVIKIDGVNHELDGRLLNGGERPLFFVDGGEGKLTLPNWRGQAQVEIRLYYNWGESANTQPEYLASEYEKQSQQK
jgi:hypothetical protein